MDHNALPSKRFKNYFGVNSEKNHIPSSGCLLLCCPLSFSKFLSSTEKFSFKSGLPKCLAHICAIEKPNVQ